MNTIILLTVIVALACWAAFVTIIALHNRDLAREQTAAAEHFEAKLLDAEARCSEQDAALKTLLCTDAELRDLKSRCYVRTKYGTLRKWADRDKPSKPPKPRAKATESRPKYRFKTEAEFEAGHAKGPFGGYKCGDTSFTTPMHHLFGHPVPDRIANKLLNAREGLFAHVPCEGKGYWNYHSSMLTPNT
jgi:hypothetical protein